MLCWSSGTFSGTGVDCKRMLFSSQGGRAWNHSTLHGDWDQLTRCKHLTQRSDCTYNSPSLSLWIHFSYSIAYLRQFLKILSVENLSDLKYLYIFKISVCSRKFSLKEKLANLSANNSNLIHHFSESRLGEQRKGLKFWLSKNRVISQLLIWATYRHTKCNTIEL